MPDFQEHYFPAFFSDEELQSRKAAQEYIAKQDHLVVSSIDAKKDFEKFYPQHKCKVEVLPFAVSNPDIKQLNAADVLVKYGVQPGYFFIANQFWIHKNHIVILEAIRKLKEEGLKYQFVFSGKTNDYRSAGHFEMLQQKVTEFDIKGQVKFLGFIDRLDQMVLMKQANSIIQPSLFEGWSTVVEDAKSLQQHIIASDLEVHKEQLLGYPHLLFNRNDSVDLAEKIRSMNSFCRSNIVYDYNRDIQVFGDKIVKILMD